MDPIDVEMTRSTRILVREGEPVCRRLRSYRLVGPDRSHSVTTSIARAGSRPGNDVVLTDESVSRLHFEIEADDIGYRLRDLGSKNGTYVDGYRVLDIYLRAGSTIRAGQVELRFDPGSEEVDVPAVAADRFGPLVGHSLKMRELFASLERAAKSDVTILVEGESGTGKELIARAVHAASSRSSGPFVVIDCGAIPAALLESELFGHERGAFTGASERRIGALEEADGGTLFLDELGELPLELQPKLLRALEAREFRRLGGRQSIPVDIRVVAATNRELSAEINRKAFREDLYYRLAVVEVRVPPLRDRPSDIAVLFEHLLRRSLKSDVKRADELLVGIGAETWKRLTEHPWRGNVRELRNLIERSLALTAPGEVPSFDPEAAPRRVESSAKALPGSADEWQIDLSRTHSDLKAEWVARFDRSYVLGQLARHDGNISRAARASGLERMHFKRILNRTR